MKVLVTGADGFVGEHLLAHLLEQPDTEISASALTLPPTRTILSPGQIASVDWKAADVLDHDALFRLVAAVRPERIYHLAGFSSGALARERAEHATRVNAGGTINLCEAVLAAKEEFSSFDPCVLVMGSGDAYGDTARDGHHLDESMQLRPISPYGLSKACQELVAHTYRRARGLRTVVVRGFNLVGPGQSASFVVPDFCRQIAEIAAGLREPVLNVGNLDVRRDFTDVRDGVEAFRLVMKLDQPEAAYNVCSGEAVAIRTVVEWILEHAGVQVEIRVDPERVRSGEMETIVGDPGRVRSATGWAPSRDVRRSVEEVYDWSAAEVLKQEGAPAAAGVAGTREGEGT